MNFELKPLPYAVNALEPHHRRGNAAIASREAYYLDYRNERERYVEAFLDHLIDWDFVAANFEAGPPRAVALAQHASEVQSL